MLHKKTIWMLALAFLLGTTAVVFSVYTNERKQSATSISIATQERAMHYAGRPDMPINKIKIRAVYFVPEDVLDSAPDSWKQDLEPGFAQVANFFNQQLHGVPFAYEVYPSIVVGQKTRGYYDGREDGLTTSGGNPNALRRIREELDARMGPGGDLSVSPDGAAFVITAIIYEGVGASAQLLDDLPDIPKAEDNPAVLLAHSFLTNPAYKDYGVTLLAHELGHALGLMHGHGGEGDDVEDLESVNTNDVMGQGRFRPLDRTYLSKESKQLLGLSY